MEKKIIIIGASSKTGEAITKFLLSETNYKLFLFSTNWKVTDVFPNVTSLNVSILNLKELKNVIYNIQPDVIINTTAINDLLKCESQKKLSWDINVLGVENIVAVSRVTDAHLIHFSCDSIFDGSKGPYLENELPNPINYYGKTKHASENFCLANHHKTTVIRTSLIYGNSLFDKSNYFLDNLSILKNEKNIYIPDDIFCNPVYSNDIAVGVSRVINKKRYGVYNFGGAAYNNLYEFVKFSASLFDYNPEYIIQSKSFKVYKNFKQIGRAHV